VRVVPAHDIDVNAPADEGRVRQTQQQLARLCPFGGNISRGRQKMRKVFTGSICLAAIAVEDYRCRRPRRKRVSIG
jgi:hypothetical protein